MSRNALLPSAVGRRPSGRSFDIGGSWPSCRCASSRPRSASPARTCRRSSWGCAPPRNGCCRRSRVRCALPWTRCAVRPGRRRTRCRRCCPRSPRTRGSRSGSGRRWPRSTAPSSRPAGTAIGPGLDPGPKGSQCHRSAWRAVLTYATLIFVNRRCGWSRWPRCSTGLPRSTGIRWPTRRRPRSPECRRRPWPSGETRTCRLRPRGPAARRRRP